MKTLWPAALAALAIAVPSLTRAAEFALVTFEAPVDFAARTDPAKADAYWARWNAVAGDMAGAGVLRGGSALKADARRVGAVPVTREPAMSGFFTVEVADQDAAMVWARKLQMAGAAAVEVRALQANPAMH